MMLPQERVCAMNGRQKNLRPWALGGCLALALAFGACKDDTERYAPDTDSETHWLQPCDEDAVCGALSCVCGVCVKACDQDAACAPLGQGALCRPADGSLGCGLTPEGGVCLPGCDADDECGALGGSARCVDGACAVVGDDPGEEVCGDRIDNDQDGEVDEGCDAPPVEVCGDGIDNDRDGEVDEGCDPDDEQALCEGTRGRWDETSCGHYQCGNPPSCEAIIPGCDCGPGGIFMDGEGCVEVPGCGTPPQEECGDRIDNDQDGFVDEGCEGDGLLCERSGGVWHPEACGHYSCGLPNECAAIIPGCDCGAGGNFMEGVGCADDPACVGGEVCGDNLDNDRDGEVDEGCAPEALCEATGGRWDENSCGHYSCGLPNECAAIIPGCDCGPSSGFLEGFGCVESPSCEAPTLDKQGLCEATAGRWNPTSCGDYVCGQAPLCEAVIPGCDCGPREVFVEGQGCVAWRECAPFDSWVVEPGSLEFFFLPINSVRGAVSGYVPEARACVTVVWDYSNTGRFPVRLRCDEQGDGFPYVILETETDGPCGAWEGGGNVVVTEAKGCVDFAGEPGSLDLVDVSLEVESEAFTGEIVVSNLRGIEPRVVPTGVVYGSDIPERVYVQSVGASGAPGWLRVTQGGVDVQLFDSDDLPRCGEDEQPAPRPLEVAEVLDGTSARGGYFRYWDGMRRVLREAGCYSLEPLPPGEYDAELCFGYEFDAIDSGDVIRTPFCLDQRFTWPTADLIFTVDNGG